MINMPSDAVDKSKYLQASTVPFLGTEFLALFPQTEVPSSFAQTKVPSSFGLLSFILTPKTN